MTTVPTLRSTTREPHSIDADALVLGLAAGESGPTLAGPSLPKAAARQLAEAVEVLGLSGKPEEVTRLAGVPGISARSVVLTGLGAAPGSAKGKGRAKGGGADTAYDPEVLRRAAGAAVRSVSISATTVALALPADGPDAVAATAEGAYLGGCRYDPSGRPSAESGPQLLVATGSRSSVSKDAVTRASILGARRAWACDLVNTPPNLLRPDSFATRVRSEARAGAARVSVSVMDQDALLKAGCGGILGVGQGSDIPPRIVTMTYAPSRPKARIALVGKGITFDTGGYRLKPIEGMAHMKSDMAGAAAVAAAVLAVAELGLPVAVTGYLCLAENMVSGAAQRPSDVVTMRNGTTVEVLDPDAEGRMVLADGMCLASEKQPDALVDIATLTGAQVIALGDDIAALMGNDDAFTARLHAAAQAAGEAMWVMPLPADYRAQLDTPFADIAHKGGRAAGMLTAGIFLQEFVGDGIPWAHVDMAGPAYHDGNPRGYTPKGGTGYGVASLVSLAESYVS